MKPTCLIIPAFEPNRALIDIISSVLALQLSFERSNLKIMVVDDGSVSSEAIAVFSAIKEMWPEVDLVELDKNVGKGEALKIALYRIQQHMPDIEWVVTADADGQHLPKDICALIEAGERLGTPALGVRAFDTDVPLRSHIGNSVTRGLFKVIYGGNIADTQTGLRGFSHDAIDDLLDIKVGKYAFELEALILFVKQGGLRQIPITTVYEPSNPTSHFRPFLDSMHIYWVLLRHIICTVLAMFAEVGIFYALSKFGLGVALALTIARIVAGTALFFAARQVVFGSKASFGLQAAKYLMLVVANLVVTIWIVNWLTDTFYSNLIPSLFVAYSGLFIANFLVQKVLIFARGDGD